MQEKLYGNKSDGFKLELQTPERVKPYIGNNGVHTYHLAAATYKEAVLESVEKKSGFAHACLLIENKRQMMDEEIAHYARDLLQRTGNNAHHKQVKHSIVTEPLISDTKGVVEAVYKKLKEQSKDMMLRELLSLFISEHTETISSRSLQDYTYSYRVFYELFGNIRVKEIDRETGITFKVILKKYPKNRSKSLLRNRSIDEIFTMKYEPISQRTVSKIFGHISSVLSWASKQGFIEKNPFNEIAPRTPKRNSTRRSFTHDELSRVFSHKIFTEQDYRFEWQFWLPILGYATGARLDELCHLRTSHICEQDNLYFIDMVERDGVTLKNQSSNRRIPIHSRLIELGFLKFAKRKRGELFDLAHYKTPTYGHQPSKWFGELKRSLRLDKAVTFHSLRHHYRDMLSEHGVPGERVKAIMGHSQRDETFGTYGSSLPLHILNESVQSVRLRHIEHLDRFRALAKAR